MSKPDQRVVDALKKPRRPLVTAAVVVGVVVALSGAGIGAYALNQALNAESATLAVADEPTVESTPNEAPAASFSFTTVEGLAVTVDGSHSNDPDGSIDTFTWDFGDEASATGAVASHTYAGYGTWTVTLTVTDDAGDTATFSATVDLIAPPPPPPPSIIRCPAGTTPGAVDDAGNESNCQPLNDAGQQCVAYDDNNTCTQWYKP